MKSFYTYIKELYMQSRLKLVVNLALMVVLGMLEGIGILMLIPLLHLAGLMPDAATTSGMDQGVKYYFHMLGPSLSLPVVLLIYTAIILIQSWIQSYQSNLNARIQQSFYSYLSVRLFQALAFAKWPFLAARKKSDITHLLTSELGRVAGGTQFLLQMTATAIISGIQIGIAFYISPPMTTVVIIGGVLFSLLMQTYVRKAKKTGAELSQHSRTLFFAITEHLNGIKEVKSCGMESMHIAFFSQLRKSVEENFVRFNLIQSRTQMLYKVGAAVFISAFFYSAVKVFQAKPEELLLIIVIFARLWPRLSSFQGGLQNVVMMLPAFNSVLDFERQCIQEKEFYREEEPAHYRSLNQGIELQDVTFKYASENTVNRVTDLSFVIPAGQTVALVGVSGAGKSTVADLITGMLIPQKGKVLIDGAALEISDIHLWRRSIGYVTQDAFLFNASIRENMLWANPSASREDIWESLRQAAVDDFVANLPEDLDTVVGDRGVRLSGGERQRIVLARALVRKPTVLILDEATSSLDIENEKRIQQAIENLHGKLTILIIAHRLSAIKNADRIIVLEKGTKLEEGSFEELITNKEGWFYRINIV